MKELLLYILVISLFSCGKKQPAATGNFRQLVTDTSITHRPGIEIGISKEKSELLNLPVIFNGVDSFELRIWCANTWFPQDLFTLRYSQNKWIASNYIYHEGDGIVDSLHLTTREMSGDTASKIQRYLSQDSILDLPTQNAIPGFRDHTAHGQGYLVEIASNKFYKCLEYRNPSYYNDMYNNRFLRLLEFLKTYFEMYVPDKVYAMPIQHG